MDRRSLENRGVRGLTKVPDGTSYGITLPKESESSPKNSYG